MKKIAASFLLILLFGCASKEDALIGKWDKTEEHYGGVAGENVLVQKIKNSKTYTFKDSNKLVLVADGVRFDGVYEIVENEKDVILHTITFPQKGTQIFDQYFRISFSDSTTMKKLEFIPVHPENVVMYSSGRKDIYEKRD